MIFLGIVVGIVIGSHLARRRRGARRRLAVVAESSPGRRAFFVLTANVLWLGGCFFVLAALTRQMAPVYVAGVIALVGYLFAANLLGDMENKTLAALIDPSGATAADVLTRYWSVAQKNEQQIPLEGVLLLNRLLWACGFGAVVTWPRLSRVQDGVGRCRRQRRKRSSPTSRAMPSAAPPRAPRRFPSSRPIAALPRSRACCPKPGAPVPRRDPEEPAS